MNIGITGATGQLGRLVIRELQNKASGDSLIALVRSPQKAADMKVEARGFDYAKSQNLAGALNGIDKLLLISGSEIGKRAEQHINVIEAAKKAGIKLIVYTSLLHADSSTISIAGEHVETENALKKSGIPYIILRNGWYTENYTASVGGVVSGGVLYGSSGNGKISSASREDFALAAAAVLSSEGHENKTYELAGDEAYTMSDYAKTISEKSGKTIEYRNIPVNEFADALKNAGLPEGVAQFLAGTHVSTEKGDLFDDGHQLSKLIGRPTTSLEKSVEKALTTTN